MASEKKTIAPVVKVLLTGGPGAGKSSALATVRDRISKRGFQAVVVPEGATTLLDNSGGYDPSWHGTDKHIELQQAFLKWQIQQEDIYSSLAALRPGKPHLLLHDRGCLDGRLFSSADNWVKVMEGVGVTEEELLKRYDLVIHMTTVASGMENLYDYGPGSSNPSRYHTPEQARQADNLAQEVYAKHPHVRVVPNFPDFNKKMEAVVNCVTEAVQVDGLAGPRERCIMNPSCAEDAFKVCPVDFEVYNIEVSFLDAEFTESVRRRQLVPRATHREGDASLAMLSEPPEVQYEFRQEVILDGQSVNTRKVLTADAYSLLKQSRTGSFVDLKKRATCFTWQGSYYEIYSYMDGSGKALPETCELCRRQVLDRPAGAPVPPWLGAADVLPEAGVSEAFEAAEESAAAERSTPLASRPHFRRVLSRNATAEAAACMEKQLVTPPAKRSREDLSVSKEEHATSSSKPLKRQCSGGESGSLSKVVAGSLTTATAAVA